MPIHKLSQIATLPALEIWGTKYVGDISWICGSEIVGLKFGALPENAVDCGLDNIKYPKVS